MSYSNWDDGYGNQPTGYAKSTGRGGKGYCLNANGSQGDLFIAIDYPNVSRKFTVVYSYKNKTEFFWEADNLYPHDNSWHIDNNNLELKVTQNTRYIKNINDLVLEDKYNWYTVKINFEYNSTTHDNFIVLSYLNDEDVWVEVHSMVYNYWLPSGFTRYFVFDLYDDGYLDDVNIGVVV